MLVRSITVTTGSSEGVLGRGSGVAGDLLARIGKVLVGGLGKVLVDAGEVGDVWVGRDGVCDVGAEGEVVDDLAITVCKTELLGLIKGDRVVRVGATYQTWW